MHNGHSNRVWTTDQTHGWALATVVSSSPTAISLQLLKNGEVRWQPGGWHSNAHALTPGALDAAMQEVTRAPDQVIPSNQSEPGELRAVADLTKLPALHEPALLQALNERFTSDDIYTFVGPILIAVNPFRRVQGLYDAATMKRWIAQQRDLPPHVFGVADAAFRAMVDEAGCNQSILVSGESGAGKTETTKISARSVRRPRARN
jgi:myosin heavy subunit